MQSIRATLVLLGAALIGIAPVWAQESDQKPAAKAEVGKAAPDFTLTDCFGKQHKLADLKDKVVVLEWVNQQCPWSVKAIEDVKKLRKKFDEKGVVWLGIESTHGRKPGENVEYIKEKELNYPILMDNDGKVGRTYGARTTPHLFVINKGNLVYAGALHDDQYGRKKEGEARHYIDEALTAVLKGEKVPLAETKPWGCSVKYESKKAE